MTNSWEYVLTQERKPREKKKTNPPIVKISLQNNTQLTYAELLGSGQRKTNPVLGVAADSFISEAANSEVANTTRRQKTACAHLTLELCNLSARISLDFWPVPGTQDYSLFIHTSTYIHRLVDPWDTLQQITTGRSNVSPRTFESTRAARSH